MRAALLLAAVLGASVTAFSAGPYGGTVTTLVLDEERMQPAWAGTDRGLFAYREGHWQRVESVGQKPVLAVVDVRGRLVLASEREGLLASNDGGETWKPVTEGLKGKFGHPVRQILSLASSPSDPYRLYLGGGGAGPFASTDGGRSWKLLLEGLEGEPPPALHAAAFVAPEASRPLLMGTAGRGVYAWVGGRWSHWSEGLPADTRVQVLASHPSRPDHVVLGTRGEGVWESRDGGRSWKLLRKGLYGVADAVAVNAAGEVLCHFPEEGFVLVRGGEPGAATNVLSPWVQTLQPLSQGGWVAGLAHDGVLRLDADGRPVGPWNEGLDATRVTSLALGPDGGLWAGDANGVFFSGDEGKAWEARDAGHLGASANHLLWHRGVLMLGSGGQGVYAWDGAKRAWEQRANGMGTANTIFSFDQDASGQRLYVGTEGGILRSDDAGGQWERKNEGLPPANTWQVAASRAQPGVLWGSGGGRLVRSDDGGDAWRPAGMADAVSLAARSGDEGGVLWVLEPLRLRKIEQDWEEEVPLPLAAGERANVLAVAGEDAFWVGTSKGLWLVDAGGAESSWEGCGILALQPTPEGRLWAGTDGCGVLGFR